jgi:hypothetical protein
MRIQMSRTATVIDQGWFENQFPHLSAPRRLLTDDRTGAVGLTPVAYQKEVRVNPASEGAESPVSA